MSRSEGQALRKNEANSSGFDDESGPMIYSISKAERTFRWISEFRNEPKFEVAPVNESADVGPPDRAA